MIGNFIATLVAILAILAMLAMLAVAVAFYAVVLPLLLASGMTYAFICIRRYRAQQLRQCHAPHYQNGGHIPAGVEEDQTEVLLSFAPTKK